MIRFGVCVHSLYCSPHHQKSHGGQPKNAAGYRNGGHRIVAAHRWHTRFGVCHPTCSRGNGGQLPALLAELGEQAVTVGQTGVTAQTVASVAGSEEEDIFGDEDGI